jgi:hypothetical protein
MYVFVRDHFTMIAAPVQCDVDGIPKESHNAKSTARSCGVANDARSTEPPFVPVVAVNVWTVATVARSSPKASITRLVDESTVNAGSW